MIFELPDIFFGSHPKKEMASQPLQVRQYGFAKNSKKPYHKRIFKKSGDIFFGATSQKKHLQKQVLLFLEMKRSSSMKNEERCCRMKYACGK